MPGQSGKSPGPGLCSEKIGHGVLGIDLVDIVGLGHDFCGLVSTRVELVVLLFTLPLFFVPYRKVDVIFLLSVCLVDGMNGNGTERLHFYRCLVEQW
jgi:hypothetical protein